MTNVCLITNGSRPRLLEQTLRTLYANTPVDQYNITMVSENSNMKFMVPPWDFIPENLRGSMLTIHPPCNIIGRLKNLGAYWSEKQFGRGEWLCVCDDDLAFTLGWLEAMQATLLTHNQVRVLGSSRHPYHGINSIPEELSLEDLAKHHVEVTDAVAGYLHFMRWSTFDKFGPYTDNQKGLGASEDFALCRKVVDAGGAVGYISPACVYHTGVTNSEGNPILGAELIEKVEDILYL